MRAPIGSKVSIPKPSAGMLTELFIKNFAIIDDLHIRFEDGLTVLTGETGAGKSIIVQAFNLILGNRATAKMIRSGAETAELEALFHVLPDSDLARRVAAAGYDISEGLLIKRVISQNDRHRTYINGHIATVQVLSAITENLANISGQFASQGLLKEEQQLEALDRFGGLADLRKETAARYQEVLPLIDQLSRLEEKQQHQAEHMELLRFQKTEIAGASPIPGEDAELEQEKQRLKNAEFLYQAVYEGIEALYGAPGAATERLMEVQKGLEQACRIDGSLRERVQGIADAVFRLEDTVAGLREYLKGIQMDEGRLEAVESRLDVLNKLKRKYGPDLNAVLSRLNAIETELAGIEDLPERIQQTKDRLSALHTALTGAAGALSEKRTQASRRLSRAMETELASLRMGKTRFDVAFSRFPAGRETSPFLMMDGVGIQETGIDRITFMIAPNVGEALKPLSQIASGGELSRVVLALKALLAQTDSLETLVFDEVDAGIGGGVAETVGKKLHALSRFHQVICITHLPQIAVYGDHHFRIEKTVSRGRTRTVLAPLDKAARVLEIARMLGGEKITPTTLDHAREMMEKGAEG
ncbi:MAG: DNA repair protein RecN [Deltaproteobacteria bacterium]|nr:DNA repair protein RecN [Deltaproteobacteria bacterium]MBW2041717.1 DNA repair protein RecN [Deltaproteobacteria bacterium]